MKKANKRLKGITIREYPVTGSKLKIKLHGSKNCALAVVMYTFLVGKGNHIIIRNVPPITDVINTLEIFEEMGGTFRYEKDKNRLVVFEGIKTYKIPRHLLGKTRISLLLMSIILVRYGKVIFPKKVGGCNLGHRPYDYHLEAFKKLGCIVEENSKNYIIVKSKFVKNKIISFKQETTTGTENAIFLANFNSENILIKKAHQRPEILELVKFMNRLGGDIHIEKDVILLKKAQKVIENKKITFTIIDDLEEALSYVALGFITDSSLNLQFKNPYDYNEIKTLINLSKGSLKRKGNLLIQTPYSLPKHKFVEIITGAYPGFSSDAQPIMAAILLKVSESFKITETRFIERFKYSEYFDEFGIKNRKTATSISVISDMQILDSFNKNMSYHKLVSYDLRSAMSAFLIASIVRRKVIILNTDLILRGYVDFFKVLEKLKFKISQS